jgi:hypothetical protein
MRLEREASLILNARWRPYSQTIDDHDAQAIASFTLEGVGLLRMVPRKHVGASDHHDFW